MKYINSCFKTKKVIEIIDNLIVDYLKKDLSDFTRDDMELITSYICELDDYSGLAEGLLKSKFKECLIDSIRNPHSEHNDYKLSSTTKELLVNYYSYTVEGIINERLNTVWLNLSISDI